LKPDISLATKTGHFNLLPTGKLLTVFKTIGSTVSESERESTKVKSPTLSQRTREGWGTRVDYVRSLIAEVSAAVEPVFAGYPVPALLSGRPAVALHKECLAYG